MSIKQFKDKLHNTFSATGIESASRKELLDMADHLDIDQHEYQRIRSQLFHYAAEKNCGFVWLEDAMKVLDKARAISMTSRVFFSPENSGQEELELQLNSARRSIWVCVFTISDDELAKAIIHQNSRGLDVKVLTDNDKAHDRGSDIYKMRSAGVKVKIDNTRHHMHHKFAIIDAELLINGSYNWTRSANEHNQENLIVTKDEALVRAFSREFNRLWEEMSWL